MSERPRDRVPDAQAGREVPLGRWYVVLPAAAFLLGLLLGGVLVGVARDDASGTVTPRATADRSTGSAGPTSTTVTVPSDCAAVADTVDEALDVVRRSAAAVRDLRAGEIVDLLNRLEDLDAEVREQASACRGVEVDQPTSPAPTSSDASSG